MQLKKYLVNTPPPKAGGFGLRLKAGSIGHSADYPLSRRRVSQKMFVLPQGALCAPFQTKGYASRMVRIAHPTLLLQYPPQGEGWGEGINKTNCLIIIPSSWPSPEGRRESFFILVQDIQVTTQIIVGHPPPKGGESGRR